MSPTSYTARDAPSAEDVILCTSDPSYCARSDTPTRIASSDATLDEVYPWVDFDPRPAWQTYDSRQPYLLSVCTGAGNRFIRPLGWAPHSILKAYREWQEQPTESRGAAPRLDYYPWGVTFPAPSTWDEKPLETDNLA